MQGALDAGNNSSLPSIIIHGQLSDGTETHESNA